MSLINLVPRSTFPSFNIFTRQDNNTDALHCQPVCAFVPPNTNSSIRLTEYLTPTVDVFGWTPQYTCPMYNRTTGETYPLNGTDFHHANEPACTEDYCKAVTSQNFLDAMVACYEEQCPQGGKHTDLETVKRWWALSMNVKDHCEAHGHRIPAGVGVRETQPTSDIGLGPDEESVELMEFRGNCQPQLCSYVPPFTQSNVVLGQKFRPDLPVDGWSETWSCESYRKDNNTQTPHPECRKEACEAVNSREFVKSMEDCYRRECEDDADFEYNWKLLKGMTRREPFQTKVRESFRESCEEEGVEIPEWKEDGKNNDNDTNNDNDNDGDGDGDGEGDESMASVTAPWKGGLLVGALLVGTFFSSL